MDEDGSKDVVDEAWDVFEKVMYVDDKKKKWVLILDKVLNVVVSISVLKFKCLFI